MNKQLFVENLFVAMFRMGFTGFTMVLANALLWLFLARYWTYRSIRPSEHAGKRLEKSMTNLPLPQVTPPLADRRTDLRA